MKARVKATGEIVEVNRPYISSLFSNDICFDGKVDNYPYLLDELDFDFVNDPDYWERLKHQYAGMAMQAYITRHDDDRFYIDDLAKDAVNFATALVEKLKEKEERK